MESSKLLGRVLFGIGTLVAVIVAYHEEGNTQLALEPEVQPEAPTMVTMHFCWPVLESEIEDHNRRLAGLLAHKQMLPTSVVVLEAEQGEQLPEVEPFEELSEVSDTSALEPVEQEVPGDEWSAVANIVDIGEEARRNRSLTSKPHSSVFDDGVKALAFWKGVRSVVNNGDGGDGLKPAMLM